MKKFSLAFASLAFIAAGPAIAGQYNAAGQYNGQVSSIVTQAFAQNTGAALAAALKNALASNPSLIDDMLYTASQTTDAATKQAIADAINAAVSALNTAGKTDTAITVSQHAAQFADAQTLSDLNAGNASIGGGSGGAGGTVVNFSGNNGGGLGGGTTSPN